MAICEKLIGADMIVDCDNPIYAGLEQVGYLINKADIASYTEADGIVSAITLETGKHAYTIQQLGSQPWNGTQTEMVEGEIMNKWNKTTQFFVLDNSPSVSSDIIEPMANGEFVIIIENKYKDDDKKNAFEIFGLQKGLHATSQVQNKNENLGAWQCTLVETETSKPSTFFFATDYTTSKAALDALLAS